jgi:hypothetical protein
MEITEKYTTRGGKQYLIRLTYNERIADTDPGTEFVRNVDVLDASTGQPAPLPPAASRFSTYESFQSFGGYADINYLGVRETAIEGLRMKVLTRIEDSLERLG